MLSRTTAVLASTLFCVLVFVAPAQAAFPGKNGKIVFDRSGQNENNDIYTINPDGTDLRRLTNNDALQDDTAFDTQPKWSPDGTKIAINRGRNIGPGSGIYVMNSDGTELRQLSAFPSVNPTWSPDGSKVAFDGEIEQGGVRRDVFVANPDGSGLANLTHGRGYDLEPAWSPDGKKVAFVDWGLGGIFTVNADGTGETRIASRYADSLAWAPGPRILFSGVVPPYASQIFAVNPDGTGETRLEGSFGRDETWSPDGKRITFSCEGICVMNADGSGQTRLTNPGFFDFPTGLPVWSPDGKKVAFMSALQLYVMNADGTQQTRLTYGLDTQPDWQPLPGPQRSDYRNAAQFCKADRDFLGDAAFAKRYGTNGNGANAYGKCVSQNR